MNTTLMSKLLIAILAFSSISPVIAKSAETELAHQQVNDVAWSRAPRVQLREHELKGIDDRILVIRMYVNAQGRIEKTIIIQSSGIPSIDAKVERAVKVAKFQPYRENGVALPFMADQPFFIKAENGPSQSNQCIIDLKSKQWHAQQNGSKTNFTYLQKPNLYLHKAQLENQNRDLEIEFKLSNKNEVSNIHVVKSSGLHLIDKQVTELIHHSKFEAPRKFYQFYKLKFSDHIYFNLDDCN